MSAPHTATLKLAQIEATRKGWRLFQNAVGLGWVGKLHAEHRDAKAGLVVTLIRAVRLRYGLTTGSFDLVGWRPLVITPDMVGMTIAQFATVDAKTQGARRLSPEQLLWARAVREAGGFAAVAMREGEGVAIGEVGE